MLEIYKRRFDMGSGVGLEPLNRQMLEFVFNDQVKERLLGDYSGSGYMSSDYWVQWDERYGVGIKGTSNELVFLCVPSTKVSSIYNSLQEFGSLESMHSSGAASLIDQGDIYKYTARIIEEAISMVGPQMFISSCPTYQASTMREFIADHIISRHRRLMSQGTPDTGQVKNLATSYYSGLEGTFNKVASSGNSSPSEEVRILEELRGDLGPFPRLNQVSRIAGIA